MQSDAMRAAAEPLPIDPALPELTAALRAAHAAVLVAPPGAGKTTRVPLVLAAEPWAAGKKLIVLEPRRLAARAAAARMAATLDEAVGASVGYRVRFGSKISAATRIEVVTEGVFTRMILDDPALARCRPRLGARARRAAGPARRTQAPGDVGDARWGARG